MAATLSRAVDVHCTLQATSDSNRPFFLTSPLIRLPNRRRFFTISCSSSSSSSRYPPKPPPDYEDIHPQNPSLSDQLKSLSTTLLNQTPQQAQLQTKPKSTWVNPTRPKPSVLNLQRQKKSQQHLYNPQVRDLKHFARKLDECENSEAAFMAAIEDMPHPPSRENSLLVLNSLRQWQKTLLFFNWIKTQKLFPMETIFYNVAMKSLRFGRQFQLTEDLAYDMIDNGIELDNITYSTIITCAKRCSLFDKAVEWFERMYKTGLMPDEVTYSGVIDVYAQLGKVEEVMSLYERGRASGWAPDHIAIAVLGKMFGEAGDYDGIRYVLDEMKSLGMQPNLVVYNTLLEALGKAGKPGLARSLFLEMIELGVTPNEKTLTALVKIYGKARWGRDALDLWERMRSNGWKMDYILCNTLLSMCADLGLEEDAERLFDDMKGSMTFKPNSWSYTAMLNTYGSLGNVDKAMKLFDEMSETGVEVNVMAVTCLIQCLGRAKRIDDLVRVFEFAMERGVQPDDRMCGSLMSIISYFEEGKDVDKVLALLQHANPELVSFIKLLEEEKTSFETIKEEFKGIMRATEVEARRPFCNCLIDICRDGNLHERAHELLYMGTVYGLYPGLHTKTPDEWRLNVRSLSVGAANTAFEEWMGTVTKVIEQKEELPKLFTASTGAGTHKLAQGLASAFESQVKRLAAPFRQSEEKAGVFLATREDIIAWAQLKAPSLAITS
ncbi:pentatricopeptide repeat-containing protein At5g46580, chloroplastic [Rhododendron vialii]|uniref:pentatricopeptide repeat-containing protein At5g46580, chloroplastic n=1 Tax=Rhododendron vialii TaxID=182163 RepID=UPI00265F33C7|nr:pentatricopeptide repeat-containing protein At5g46580, chloroplastic [Rhododendron vialii]